MVDIEKLENLPFRENRAANLIKRYGNMYNIHKFDHTSHRSDKSLFPWVIAKRIINNNIGKSFDMAYHYFCTKVPIYEQHYFMDEFSPKWRYSNYYIDENKNIQRIQKKPFKKYISIQSADYKTELRHKVTGHRKEDFKEVKKPLGTYVYVIDYYTYGEVNQGYFGKMKPINERYRAKESDFEPVIVKGWIKHFESKNDPRFKRYMAEKAKSLKKAPKKVMSDEEYRAILKAKVLKDREETRIKLEAKGMRPNAFTAIKTDTNV